VCVLGVWAPESCVRAAAEAAAVPAILPAAQHTNTPTRLPRAWARRCVRSSRPSRKWCRCPRRSRGHSSRCVGGCVLCVDCWATAVVGCQSSPVAHTSAVDVRSSTRVLCDRIVQELGLDELRSAATLRPTPRPVRPAAAEASSASASIADDAADTTAAAAAVASSSSNNLQPVTEELALQMDPDIELKRAMSEQAAWGGQAPAVSSTPVTAAAAGAAAAAAPSDGGNGAAAAPASKVGVCSRVCIVAARCCPRGCCGGCSLLTCVGTAHTPPPPGVEPAVPRGARG
jgi:hypothetical protein